MQGAAGPRRLARILIGALVGWALLVVDLRWSEESVLRRLELVTLDWRFRLRGELEPGGDVVLAVVDDATIAGAGGWPLSRVALAEAVDELTAAGARVIAIDLLLADAASPVPSRWRQALRQAQEALSPDAPLRAELAELLGQGDPNLVLAAALAASGRTVLPFAFARVGAEANAPQAPPWVGRAAYRIVAATGEVTPPPVVAAGLFLPVPLLGVEAAALGHVSLTLDYDGSLRFAVPAFPYAGDWYPSLEVEAARRYLRLSPDEARLMLGDRVALGAHDVPLDERQRQFVNYYGPPGRIETVSLAAVLDGRLAPGAVQGRLVVVGATAAGTGDRFVTPFAPQLPGAEHLATTIDNILTGRSLRRDAGVRWLGAAAGVVLAMLAGWLAGRRSLAHTAAVTGALVAGWFVVAQLAFGVAHSWLAVVVPSLAILGAAAAVEAARIAATQRHGRRLARQRLNLSRYFAPAVVERLAREEHAALPERAQDAAVMFVDLVGFTGRSERMPPADAMAFLREFHGRVQASVFAHKGMVQQFVGDGALACFGVPDPSPHACADALAAARELLASVAQWSAMLGAHGEPGVPVSVGLHVGPVLVGNVGSAQQWQFTIVGDTVNVASRIEALTRLHDTPLLASEAVIDRARAAAGEAVAAGLEPVGEVPIRGRAASVRLWRLARPRQARAEATDDGRVSA